MAESVFYKIIRKTGRKPIQCKCQSCKSQCMVAPCLGTPEDIEKIIDAGYGDKIIGTDLGAGIMMGVTNNIVEMYQAKQTPTGCVFFKDGLCELHDKGLKPTEGKLSHHTHKLETFDPTKSLSWNVSKEWLDPRNKETVKRIEQKLNL